MPPAPAPGAAASMPAGPRPEVLAPAGDMDCVRAAVENGADAVYFGVHKWNARARATNFTLEELPDLLAYLRLRGVKGYVTLNTLLFSNELDEAEKLLEAVLQAGPDALLLQDLGVARLVREMSPDVPLHASTQTTTTCAEQMDLLRELGFSRVVLARELSIAEIESGIRTPLIAWGPGRIAPGVCGGLVSAVDVAPTLLSLAEVEAPATLQGRSMAPLFANPGTSIREHAFAEKNWHDYEDRSRAVRTLKYKYIRNDYPDLAGTPPADAVRSPTFRAMRRLRDAGTLAPELRGPFAKPRPAEELYDVELDPHELENLAGDSRYARILDRLQDALEAWEAETQDVRPAARTPDEFDRETGEPLPNRVRPRPGKK